MPTVAPATANMASADPIHAARSGHSQLSNNRQLSADWLGRSVKGGGGGLAMWGRGVRQA
jgi:hypothetical protein